MRISKFLKASYTCLLVYLSFFIEVWMFVYFVELVLSEVYMWFPFWLIYTFDDLVCLIMSSFEYITQIYTTLSLFTSLFVISVVPKSFSNDMKTINHLILGLLSFFLLIICISLYFCSQGLLLLFSFPLFRLRFPHGVEFERAFHMVLILMSSPLSWVKVLHVR